jgi:tetratricopeptide (TPR) repeat protein
MKLSKFLAYVLLAFLVLMPISCKKLVRTPVDTSKTPPIQEPIITKDSAKIPDITELDQDFIVLKAEGELAAKEGRLTEAIISMEKALAIKSDPQLQILLLDTYFKRGMQYYSNNDFENALFDLNKCLASHKEAKDLIRKIESTKAPITLTPADQSITDSKTTNFIWMPNELADNYQIQIESESWETILIKEVKEPHLMLTILKPGALYYWRVRVHYPIEGWGIWSTKKWFRCKE